MNGFRLAVLSVALLVCSQGFAVDLPPEHRVKNLGMYCTWASLETCGNVNNVPSLKNLMRRRYALHGGAIDPGYTESVRAQLDLLGVEYILEKDGTRNYETLRKYAETHGVVITIYAGNPHSIGCHSIVLTRYGEDYVEFYDSSKPRNGTARNLWRVKTEWLNRWWSGSAVVILGPSGT